MNIAYSTWTCGREGAKQKLNSSFNTILIVFPPHQHGESICRACYNSYKEACSVDKHIRKVTVPQGCLELTCLVVLHSHSHHAVLLVWCFHMMKITKCHNYSTQVSRWISRIESISKWLPRLIYYVINAHTSQRQVHFAYIYIYLPGIFLSAVNTIGTVNTCCNITRVQKRLTAKTPNCFIPSFFSKSLFHDISVIRQAVRGILERKLCAY